MKQEIDKLKKSINGLINQIEFNRKTNNKKLNILLFVISALILIVVSVVWLKNCYNLKDVISLKEYNILCKSLNANYYSTISLKDGENIICENDNMVIFFTKKPNETIIFSLETYKQYNFLQHMEQYDAIQPK